MKKHHKQKVSLKGKRSTKARWALLFALGFGSFMTAVGLAQLFAAPVLISLVPSAQTASPNQTKTITIFLDTDTNSVNGGSVQVNFDSSKLTFVSLDPLSTDTFTISGQQSTASQVSFDFTSQNVLGAQGQFNIANLNFTTKTVTGTQTAQLSGSANTYNGSLVRTNLPASTLSASITINGPTPPPDTTPTSGGGGGGGGTTTPLPVTQLPKSGGIATTPRSSQTNPSGTTSTPQSSPATEQTTTPTGTNISAQTPKGLSNTVAAINSPSKNVPRYNPSSLIYVFVGIASLVGGVLYYAYHPRLLEAGGLLTMAKSKLTLAGSDKLQTTPALIKPEYSPPQPKINYVSLPPAPSPPHIQAEHHPHTAEFLSTGASPSRLYQPTPVPAKPPAVSSHLAPPPKPHNLPAAKIRPPTLTPITPPPVAVKPTVSTPQPVPLPPPPHVPARVVSLPPPKPPALPTIMHAPRPAVPAKLLPPSLPLPKPHPTNLQPDPVVIRPPLRIPASPPPRPNIIHEASQAAERVLAPAESTTSANAEAVKNNQPLDMFEMAREHPESFGSDGLYDGKAAKQSAQALPEQPQVPKTHPLNEPRRWLV